MVAADDHGTQPGPLARPCPARPPADQRRAHGESLALASQLRFILNGHHRRVYRRGAVLRPLRHAHGGGTGFPALRTYLWSYTGVRDWTSWGRRAGRDGTWWAPAGGRKRRR